MLLWRVLGYRLHWQGRSPGSVGAAWGTSARFGGAVVGCGVVATCPGWHRGWSASAWGCGLAWGLGRVAWGRWELLLWRVLGYRLHWQGRSPGSVGAAWGTGHVQRSGV
ncbi:hypothetical protein Acsp04_65840 [Actinomadura sp. NBRC 104425]|nr:hypothetical protein Acsp04_65840 [Actinomadura sp. NBRC 104425]